MNNITIYGGGFTGLTATLAFARFMDKVVFIEPFSLIERPRQGRDDRTTALSYVTYNFLDEIGIWQDLLPYSGAINNIKIVDNDLYHGDSSLKLDFSRLDAGNSNQSPMGYIVENNVFRKILVDKIRSLPNVEVIEGHRIADVKNEGHSVIIKLENNKGLSAKLLLAVDGKNSPVRNLFNIKTTDKDYNVNAITFCIEHQKPHNQTAIERFTPFGPFAVLPMKEENFSSIVFTVPRETSDIYMKMDEARFKEEIERRLEGARGDFKFAGEKNSYPLKLKYAKEYFKDRVVFAGDSAHSIHPIAGQGFNQGARDLILLTKLIKERYELGLDIYNEDILKKYQRERFSDNMQMIFATDKLDGLFSNNSNILRLARRVGISAVDKFPALKKFFVKRAMGQI